MTELDLTKDLQRDTGTRVLLIDKSDTCFTALVEKGKSSNGIIWEERKFNLCGYALTKGFTDDIRIINKPQKHKLTGFLNVYPKDEGGTVYSEIIHYSRGVADDIAEKTINTRGERIGCVPIDIEYEV